MGWTRLLSTIRFETFVSSQQRVFSCVICAGTRCGAGFPVTVTRTRRIMAGAGRLGPPSMYMYEMRQGGRQFAVVDL